MNLDPTWQVAGLSPSSQDELCSVDLMSLTLFAVMALIHFCSGSWGPLPLLHSAVVALHVPDQSIVNIWTWTNHLLSISVTGCCSRPTLLERCHFLVSSLLEKDPTGDVGDQCSYLTTLASPPQHSGLPGYRDWNALEMMAGKTWSSQMNL